MSEPGAQPEVDRLRAELQALAAANRQLAGRIELADRHRRAALADEWVDVLRAATPGPEAPHLVRSVSGRVYLVESESRRVVRSGLLTLALERILGPTTTDDEQLDDLPEGPPVEVMEGASGAPFVIVGQQRLAVRGLPLPHPLQAGVAVTFEEGPELDLGTLRATEGVVQALPSELQVDSLTGLPLPTFLIIGAQKSATRWLRSNLDAHPEVFTAPGEPGFFNDERRIKRGGLSWYRLQFEGWSGETCVGESTPGYLMWSEGPADIALRIHRLLPHTRLIAVLRNPIDRARSAMIHHVVKGRLNPEASLLDLVQRVEPEQDQLGLVSGGWYAASLEPYLECFGDQVLVLLHDDLVSDPGSSYARALGHIGATPGFVPPTLALARESQEGLEHGVRSLSSDERLALWSYFSEDVARLERLLGRSLAMWAPH